MKMKKYIAIGHWGKEKDATVSLVSASATKKNFMKDCVGNDFKAYIVLTEKAWTELKKHADPDFTWEKIKHLTGKSMYRKWMPIRSYIEDAGYIIDEKLEAYEIQEG
jgi:hypothetical protein